MNIPLPGGKRDLIQKAGSSMFAVVAAASIVTAFSLVAINIMWGQFKYNAGVHSAKEEARDTLTDNLEMAEVLKASFASLNQADHLIKGQGEKKNSEIVLDALPRKYDFPALRTSIEKIAVLSGVKIAAFSGEDKESEAVNTMSIPEPIEIVFGLTIDGNYSSIRAFIANLENTIRPMRITSLGLSGVDSKMTARVEIVTYYQPSIDLTVATRTIE